MAVPSSSVEFAWQAAENLSEGGVVRLLMTALQQLECLLMTTFPRTERLLMTILCSACQCFFLLCLFQLIFWAILLYYTSISLSDSGPILVCLSLSHSMLPLQRCQPPIFSPDICAKSESSPKCLRKSLHQTNPKRRVFAMKPVLRQKRVFSTKPFS